MNVGTRDELDDGPTGRRATVRGGELDLEEAATPASRQAVLVTNAGRSATPAATVPSTGRAVGQPTTTLEVTVFVVASFLIVLVVAVVGMPIFLLWVKLDTAANNAKMRRIVATTSNENTLSPEETARTLAMVREHNAKMAYNQAVIDGRAPYIPAPMTTSQKVGAGLLVGVAAHRIAKHHHRSHR